MESAPTRKPDNTGGAFLIREFSPPEIFTPEDFTDEHAAIAETTDQFFQNEVAPQAKAMAERLPELPVSILRKSAELGLTAVMVPERYGGMELDLISDMIVTDRLSGDASYSVWHSAHSGIGTMPLLLFGAEEQKQRYLPKLCGGEMIGAYSLSESSAGSDALAVGARAVLSSDGRHYILNGQKMWTSNAGAAGLFTVFAKVDGEHFTAFLVERAFPGVSVGAEEHKMGIRGASTCPVYLDNVPVPVGNVLGEVGRGHVVAFDILDLGRLKLGVAAVGNARRLLKLSIRYAKQREAFGKPLAAFGLIRHKLAEMAVRLFAAESVAYRVAGMIQDWCQDIGWDHPAAAEVHAEALEEFSPECALVKVFATEMLDYVADEAVQIHGGYGYHQDYEVERAYRDARVNRIFEGTNEINRLLVTDQLIKRSERGRLPLAAAMNALKAEALRAPPDLWAADSREVAHAAAGGAKKVVLLALAAAWKKYAAGLRRQEELLAGITDMAMYALAMESVYLRTEKLAAAGAGQTAAAMSEVFIQEAAGQVGAIARTVLAGCLEGDELRTKLVIAGRLLKVPPADLIGLRQRIAGRLIELERFVV